MKNEGKQKIGFLLVDKPKNITSHDVVDYLRRITKIKKIGHAGTLDPAASGLLILGIGREKTKKLSFFLKMKKEYIGKVELGAVSDTYDREGKIEKKKITEIPSRKKVEKVVKKFLGKIKQIPPIFSAKKIKGKKLYERARTGERIKPTPAEIEIYNISILNYQWPCLKIKIRCSSGTYIRSLANDVGEKLGTGGYLKELCRTKIGKFRLKEAKKLKEITTENWQKFLYGL